MRALLGTQSRIARICDLCIALVWDIVAAELDVAQVDAPVGASLRGDYDERYFRGQIALLSPRLATLREERLFDDVRANETVPSEGLGDACSFCGALRADVLRLVGGGNASMCDECLECATDVLLRDPLVLGA